MKWERYSTFPVLQFAVMLDAFQVPSPFSLGPNLAHQDPRILHYNLQNHFWTFRLSELGHCRYKSLFLNTPACPWLTPVLLVGLALMSLPPRSFPWLPLSKCKSVAITMWPYNSAFPLFSLWLHAVKLLVSLSRVHINREGAMLMQCCATNPHHIDGNVMFISSIILE